MKTSTITAALAAMLLASTASAAMAQDTGRHLRGGGGQDGGPRDHGDDRPAPQANERRDMTGGEDRRGQRRSEGSADQAPAVAPTAPVAREARPAPDAMEAYEPRQPRAQFRGDGGQGLANGRGREGPPQVQNDGARGRGDNNRQGDTRRWDGNRGDGDRGDANRDGRRDGDWRDRDRRDGDHRDGDRHDGDRRWDGDRNRGDDRRWDRHDDRGRPHWQQGRYPPIYRSQNRYRYSGYYRPQSGFYSHNWGFGEFLPRGWYGSDYRLNDWWSYSLPYPPLGYDWVRVGNDALLIDQFTGRVVQVVRSLFW